MVQLIYLTRHATTLENFLEGKLKLDIGRRLRQYDFFQKLTPSGKRKSKILGQYLKRVQLNDPVFVDSGSPRGLATNRLMAREMGIELSESNHYSSRHLKEQTPLELVRKKIRNGDHFKNACQIGREAYPQLIEVCKRFSPRDIIATLHGGVNVSLIFFIGHQPLYVMHNCGLYILGREDDRLKVLSGYHPYHDLQGIVERDELAIEVRK